jgi:hypothetical protein
VGYPILNLNRVGRDLHAYVFALEALLIDVLAHSGIVAQRTAGMPGVWVDGEKIAAIGVKVARGWVSYHGFALNVHPDLTWFDHIVPCGLHGRGVTSLARVLAAATHPPPLGDRSPFPSREGGQGVRSAAAPTTDEVADHVAAAFARRFGVTLRPVATAAAAPAAPRARSEAAAPAPV